MIAAGSAGGWTPDEWENYCIQLLFLRYPTSFVRVPAESRGDWGIEGCALSDGSVYQCYCPEEPLDLATRYKKLRTKMTTDLGKLEKNSNPLSALLGEHGIHRWVMLTTRIGDKRILLHAAKKTIEYRCKDLLCLADDFTVFIQTDEGFSVEASILSEAGLVSADFDVSEPTEEVVGTWRQTHSKLIGVLDEKLTKISVLANDKVQLESYRHELLKRYIEMENLLEKVAVEHSTSAARFYAYKTAREKTMLLESLASSHSASSHLLGLADELRQDIETEIPLLRGYGRTVAWGLIAEWLQLCPLSLQ